LRKEKKMKEVTQGPVNRCFGANCPKNPAEGKDEAVKAVLKNAADKLARKRAEATINDLKQMCKGSLIKLLPVVLRRVVQKEYSRLVLEILLERIRRNQWDKLSHEDQYLVIQTEASLKQKE
jgi:hypothetical protein